MSRCTNAPTGHEADLCDGVLDDLLPREVGLIPDEQLVDALGCVPVNLLQPLLDVREGVCGRAR